MTVRRRTLLGAAAAVSASAALPAAAAGRGLRLVRDTVLDETAIYFVSYDGLVNNGSFQQSGILTYRGYQYAAWYTASRHARIARRRPDARGWQVIELPHRLSANDSHNTISLGVSRSDDRLHVAMDVHNTPVFYTVASLRGPWSADAFAPVVRTLDGVDLGGISYPQFVPKRSGGLLFSYRTGGSGDGIKELAEYERGSWTKLGAWSSELGDYHANGTVSANRNLYLHGIGYGQRDRLHATFTWRETAAGGDILCHPGGLSNHDTGYVYSDDHGRSWRTQDGKLAAVTGTEQRVSLDTPGHVIDPSTIDQALINQESQAIDADGNPHVLISAVPERFTTCVTDFVGQRRQYGRVFHLFRDRRGRWHRDELPEPLNAFGRSRLVFTPEQDAYVVMPFGRILTASARDGWRHWRKVYDGLDAFGEVLVDESRVALDRTLSVFYQEPSEGTAPSPIHVADFALPRGAQ